MDDETANILIRLRECYKKEDYKGAGMEYARIAILCFKSGYYDDTIFCLDMALKHFLKVDFKDGIGSCYYGLGITYYKKGLVENSLLNFLKALEIYENLQDNKMLKNIYHNLMICCEDLDRKDEANKYKNLLNKCQNE